MHTWLPCLRGFPLILTLAVFWGCGEPSIESAGPCHAVPCSGHGICAEVDDETAVCVCDPGYHSEGLECVEDVAGSECVGVDCGGYGTCVVVEGDPDSPLCMCEPGSALRGTTLCVPDPDPEPSGKVEVYEDSQMLRGLLASPRGTDFLVLSVAALDASAGTLKLVSEADGSMMTVHDAVPDLDIGGYWYSPSGEHVVFQTTGGEVGILTVGRDTATVASLPIEGLRTLDFSGNARYAIATGVSDAGVWLLLLDLVAELVSEVTVGGADVRGAFTGDDAYFVVHDGGALRMHPLGGGPTQEPPSMVLSPVDDSIAYARDGEVYVVAASGGMPAELNVPGDPQEFSPDGRHVITQHVDGIHVASIETRDEVAFAPGCNLGNKYELTRDGAGLYCAETVATGPVGSRTVQVYYLEFETNTVQSFALSHSLRAEPFDVSSDGTRLIQNRTPLGSGSCNVSFARRDGWVWDSDRRTACTGSPGAEFPSEADWLILRESGLSFVELDDMTITEFDSDGTATVVLPTPANHIYLARGDGALHQVSVADLTHERLAAQVRNLLLYSREGVERLAFLSPCEETAENDCVFTHALP